MTQVGVLLPSCQPVEAHLAGLQLDSLIQLLLCAMLAGF